MYLCKILNLFKCNEKAMFLISNSCEKKYVHCRHFNTYLNRKCIYLPLHNTGTRENFVYHYWDYLIWHYKMRKKVSGWWKVLHIYFLNIHELWCFKYIYRTKCHRFIIVLKPLHCTQGHCINNAYYCFSEAHKLSAGLSKVYCWKANHHGKILVQNNRLNTDFFCNISLTVRW